MKKTKFGIDKYLGNWFMGSVLLLVLVLTVVILVKVDKKCENYGDPLPSCCDSQASCAFPDAPADLTTVASLLCNYDVDQIGDDGYSYGVDLVSYTCQAPSSTALIQSIAKQLKNNANPLVYNLDDKTYKVNRLPSGSKSTSRFFACTQGNCAGPYLSNSPNLCPF